MASYDYLTPWEKVVFRNYGMVKTSLIGKVIGLSEGEVVSTAVRLGLSGMEYEPLWREKGFVTILRNNWELLSVDELATLLEIGADDLERLLSEYDFLDVKLGKQPALPDVSYRPPTPEHEKDVEAIRQVVEASYVKRTVRPFDFFRDYVEPYFASGENGRVTDRFVSSYCAKYSGALLDDDLSDYEESYLQRLAACGTNGIWLSDTLRNLAEFPFDRNLSPDWERRVRNLRKLTERCKKHGIRVYLYLNEPRSLPEGFFAKYPDLKGQKTKDGEYCLCTSREEVRQYLYNAVKSLAESVPELYAVMTITMSENPTHCYSRYWGNADKIRTDCPNCGRRKPQAIVAEINNTIHRALKDGNGRTRLIANVWGWANFSGEGSNEVHEAIDLLDRGVDVLCVSEYGKEFVRGGVRGKVDDYSISVPGYGEFAGDVLTYARTKGHKTWAKVQINNSWECSAVPYLPTFGLMTEHVRRLKDLGVSGLMLGWSLGGYAGGALPLVNSMCGNEDFDENEWYAHVYGDDAPAIRKAVQAFDGAFGNYPFSVDTLYYGAQNLGCGNLWSLEREDRASTMVCFTFDDVEKWTSPYGVDVYIDLMTALCGEWEKGLALLDNAGGTGAAKEFKTFAKAAYIHFRSALNLAVFSKCKWDPGANKGILTDCLNNELAMTKELYRLMASDARIGFEMTNHYSYSENLLLEKIVNLKRLLKIVAREFNDSTA